MKRNFKKAVSLALASTMALSLAACGGTSASTDTTAAGKAEGGDSAASNEEVTLKFSWWGGDARHEATEKAIAAFMEKYPTSRLRLSMAHGPAGKRSRLWRSREAMQLT